MYCFSGAVCLFAPLIAWYKAGAKPEDAPKNTSNYQHLLWVIDPRKGNQAYSAVERCPYPEPLTFPAAMGSGRDFALGAVLAGAELREAVEVAIALDVYSGGEIKIINIPEPLPEDKPKPKQGWFKNALRRYLTADA